MKALKENFKDYKFDKPDAKLLERFDSPFIEYATEITDETFLIKIDCFEFTSLCPVTGQPDYGKIYIEYVPFKYCVESKSLKLYLMSFRNHGEFHEACTQRIGADLYKLLLPRYLKVIGKFNGRGGISIHPEVIYRSQ